MDDIAKLRQDIDSIDKELVKLFERRMETVLKVAEYKKTNGIPILNSKREEEVIRKNIEQLKNKNFESATVDFFNNVMEISRKVQKDKRHDDVGMHFYGLIGEKLEHSFSPIIHSIIFEELHMKGCYNLFEVKKGVLKDAVYGLKALGAKGANVTIPYKLDVMKYLDNISKEAQRIGAVNTICFKDNETIGYNTDYYGFGMMLDKHNISLKNKKAVILGTGGASKSVIQYLLDNDIKDITIVSRDVKAAKGKEKYNDFKIISYEQIELLKERDIIINCTPCGMHPKTNNSPIKKEYISKFNTAVDLIYNPLETLFLKYGREKGVKTINGLYMLVGQAVKAQELWNNIKIESSICDKIYEKTIKTLNTENTEKR